MQSEDSPNSYLVVASVVVVSKNNMFIIKYKNWFFALTAALVLTSLASVFLFGLKLGLDFTGGSLVQVSYPAGRPSSALLETALKRANIQGYSVRDAGNTDYIIRAQTLTN